MLSWTTLPNVRSYIVLVATDSDKSPEATTESLSSNSSTAVIMSQSIELSGVCSRCTTTFVRYLIPRGHDHGSRAIAILQGLCLPETRNQP